MRKLLIFADAPVAGAPIIPEPARLRLLRHTLETADGWRQAGGGTVELWAAPDAQSGSLAEIARGFDVVLKTQPSGSRGARTWLALCGVLAAGDVPLLIGTACPWLTADHLAAASAALARADAVFVPSDHGDYVLAGLHRAVPELFTGIDRDGARLMAAIHARAKKFGCSLAELESLPGTDTAAGWSRLKADARLAHLAGDASPAAD